MTTEFLLDQITSISKAGAYDAILPEYKRLQEVNAELLQVLQEFLNTYQITCENCEVDFDKEPLVIQAIAAIKKAKQPV